MDRIENKVIEEEGIGHAESHAAIVSPDPDLARTSIKLTLLYLFLHVVEVIGDQIPPIFDEGNELSGGSQSITDCQPQKTPYSPGLLLTQPQRLQTKRLLFSDLLEERDQLLPIWVCRRDDTEFIVHCLPDAFPHFPLKVRGVIQ